MAETQSPAITSASAASAQRKRVILLCCEDLRPVACSLEVALRSRGWDVSVEFGQSARPWVQQTPPGPPSVRVLCVPGTVDRTLAEQLRTAFGPAPDADLHILGVDDSRGLVREVERLAGVKHPSRRSLYARPRLSHPTLVETSMQRERHWLMGSSAALAAFAITLGGIAVTETGTADVEGLALPSASITAPVTTPTPSAPEATPAMFDEPLYAAAAVAPSFEDWEDDLPPEEEDDDYEIIILDDEPTTTPRVVDVVAPPLAEPHPAIAEALAPEEEPVAPLDTELTVPGAQDEPTQQLPVGFLPVAGMTVAAPPPPAALQDPFATPASVTTPIAVTTIDPFATMPIVTVSDDVTP